MNHRAFLFDLDGTLLDTAGDMVGAVNMLLAEEGRAPRPVEVLTPFVSQGGLVLVSRGFDLDQDEPETRDLWRRYLDLYEANICNHTALFKGLHEILVEITQRGQSWAVVTNKPLRFTLPLMALVDLPGKPGSVVCGDTLAQSKPSPEPVLLACEQLGVEPAAAVMIGDDERDIVAGRDAGCITLAAAWGYIQPDDDPAAWGADGVVAEPGELIRWID